MKRNLFFTCTLLWTMVLVMVPCGAFAQQAAPAAFSQQELDQMCAPIALYPDSLLAQLLIAATYPDQVMDADHWLKANPNLRGDPLNDALDRMNWDLSVKALAPFPQVLSMMAERPEWTEKLGEAFLAQQADVMDSVQRLRAKAQAAGNLRSTPEQRVVVQDNAIEIEPVNPEVVCIPRYDPAVVYGSWWWPAYPPFAYAPIFPGVVIGSVGAFGFWPSVAVGPAWGWGWGSWGWGSHDVNINVNRTININRTTNVSAVRSGMRTSSLSRTVAAGQIGSTKVRAAAFSRTGATTGSSVGKTQRPSATSIQQGLKGTSSGTGAGGTKGQLGTTSGTTKGQLGTPAEATKGQLGTPSGATKGQLGTTSGTTKGQLGTPAEATKGQLGTPAGATKGQLGTPAGATKGQLGTPAGGGAKPEFSPGSGGTKSQPAPAGGSKTPPGGGTKGDNKKE